MDIVLSPRKVTRFLAGVILFLTLAHLAGLISTFFLGHNHVFGLVPLFDLNSERNLPTLYAGLGLLFCAVLLGLIAWVNRANFGYLPWAGLSLIFVFLFYDELISIHEGLIEPLQAAWNTSGFLRYAWVIPYGLFVVVLALVYSRFLLRLPGDTRRYFLLAGLLFVTGALGVEVLGGQQATLQGKDLGFEILVMIEEILEMVGVLVFIHALLAYIETHLGGIRLLIGGQAVDY
jgi:hypothetical protein